MAVDTDKALLLTNLFVNSYLTILSVIDRSLFVAGGEEGRGGGAVGSQLGPPPQVINNDRFLRFGISWSTGSVRL